MNLIPITINDEILTLENLNDEVKKYNTPEINNKVASKFLILNALYEADATKNASRANIVEPRGR